MSNAVRNLEPREMWRHFADLNAVPRPSKQEQRVIAFMKEFGNRLGLKTLEDETGNVIISKPATTGMEDRVTVVLQGHLDMVHQKNADTVFDFDTQDRFFGGHIPTHVSDRKHQGAKAVISLIRIYRIVAIKAGII